MVDNAAKRTNPVATRSGEMAGLLPPAVYGARRLSLETAATTPTSAASPKRSCAEILNIAPRYPSSSSATPHPNSPNTTAPYREASEVLNRSILPRQIAAGASIRLRLNRVAVISTATRSVEIVSDARGIAISPIHNRSSNMLQRSTVTPRVIWCVATVESLVGIVFEAVFIAAS